MLRFRFEPPPPNQPDRLVRRELYSFGLYRVLEAALMALIFFGPGDMLYGEPRHGALGEGTALVYMLLALLMVAWAQGGDGLRWQVLVGVTIDLAAAALAIHAMPTAVSALSVLLLFNIGAAGLLLPLRFGMAAAALGAAMVIGEYSAADLLHEGGVGLFAERLMFAASYGAFAVLTSLLGRKMRGDQALAARRGAEVADMAALNELIIRRMRIGVLLVDGQRRIRPLNEAARGLLGQSSEDLRERDLAHASPELARDLDTWRKDDTVEPAPLTLGEEQVEVLPSFARLMDNSGSTLVFLDDVTQVSHRAESLTLATMGRFSASLAHEIRNPLAAMSYATQLLEESDAIGDSDRRLLKILHQQIQRTNTTIESVLGLARRERANPEYLELGHFVRRFIDDYRQVLPEENGVLRANAPGIPIPAMIDPRHLQQVLTVLVHNALTHGRMPGEIPRVTISVHQADGGPAIDVLDRGPGIPPRVQAQLFRAFHSTSEQGTGLGLYIARELCNANQASLDYVGVPAGGSCFRLIMPAPQSLLQA